MEAVAGHLIRAAHRGVAVLGRCGTSTVLLLGEGLNSAEKKKEVEKHVIKDTHQS